MKVQLVSSLLLYRNVLPTIFFSLVHEGFVYIFPVFYKCSREQISHFTYDLMAISNTEKIFLTTDCFTGKSTTYIPDKNTGRSLSLYKQKSTP